MVHINLDQMRGSSETSLMYCSNKCYLFASTRYDHLRKEASDYQPYETDATSELWRAALDVEVAAYTANHYRHGVSSVFGRSTSGQISLTVCIEDHQFQPNNFCNGRWRSQWQVSFQPGTGSVATELKGILKVQVNLLF